jgi:hypothetical protein
MANHDDRNHYQRSPDSPINKVLNQHTLSSTFVMSRVIVDR